VEAFLDELAARQRIPGAGTAAAMTAAMGAALVTRAARYSGASWPGADAAEAQAETLRERVLGLRPELEATFADALRALDEPRDADPDRRNFALGVALESSVEPLVKLSEVSADVAALAADVAERGAQELRPDVTAGATLAESAARTAAVLVAANLGAAAGDERLARAEHAAESAGRAVRRASGE
jgi:formiminotetrahydrofolate cyclodeaminase